MPPRLQGMRCERHLDIPKRSSYLRRRYRPANRGTVQQDCFHRRLIQSWQEAIESKWAKITATSIKRSGPRSKGRSFRPALGTLLWKWLHLVSGTVRCSHLKLLSLFVHSKRAILPSRFLSYPRRDHEEIRVVRRTPHRTPSATSQHSSKIRHPSREVAVE